MENFNLKKFLVENKLTTNSRTLKESEEKVSFDNFDIEEGHTGAVVASVYRTEGNKVYIETELESFSGSEDFGIHYSNLNFDKVFQDIFELGGRSMDKLTNTIYLDEGGKIEDYLDKIDFNDSNSNAVRVDSSED